MAALDQRLDWSQRIAFVRHNLHAASRSGDFTFFKALQAHGFTQCRNPAATLSAILGDEADPILAALDDLNAGMGQVFQDAFKQVYDALKENLANSHPTNAAERKSQVYVDAAMQKQKADMALDRLTTTAVTLIQQQPHDVQDNIANVWITGAIVMSDCVQVCLKQMDKLETDMDDFIRLEDSWDTVKASVGCTVAALRGIFNLMAISEIKESQHSRQSSIAAGAGSVFRRLSNAFIQQTPSPSSRSSSISAPSGSARSDAIGVAFGAVNYARRSSVSHAGSSSDTSAAQARDLFRHTELSPIPPTPAAFDMEVNPFETGLPPVPSLPRHVAALHMSQSVTT